MRWAFAMFRIATLNVNGIRSATRKGLTQWLEQLKRRRRLSAGSKSRSMRRPRGKPAAGECGAWYHCAARRGYAGTALYAVKRPREVRLGFGSKEFDAEGRYVEAQFSTVTIISVYFPSGSSGPHRQESKFRFLARFLPHLKRLAASGREFILCGDINIAHREIDLKNLAQQPEAPGCLMSARGCRACSNSTAGSTRLTAIAARSVTPGGATSAGVREKRRLAHRLPDRHAGHRQTRTNRGRST